MKVLSEVNFFQRLIDYGANLHDLKDNAEAAYARSDLLEKRADMMETRQQIHLANSSDGLHLYHFQNR